VREGNFSLEGLLGFDLLVVSTRSTGSETVSMTLAL
jgi:hypothetical protein